MKKSGVVRSSHEHAQIEVQQLPWTPPDRNACLAMEGASVDPPAENAQGPEAVGALLPQTATDHSSAPSPAGDHHLVRRAAETPPDRYTELWTAVQESDAFETWEQLIAETLKTVRSFASCCTGLS